MRRLGAASGQQRQDARAKQLGATPDIEVRLRAEITKLKKTTANKNEKLKQLEADLAAPIRAVHVLTLENQASREQLAQPRTNVVAVCQRSGGSTC
ncbi:regulator of replication initiation timing [Catenulispora sp. MAP12-49]|uniref:hypothetical protein n=1 Tax=unclassified Catenulispora TaxID=414885 RepID=UPI00351463C7